MMTKTILLFSTMLLGVKAQCTDSYVCADTEFCWGGQCRDTADAAVCKTYRGVPTAEGLKWRSSGLFGISNFKCEKYDLNFCISDDASDEAAPNVGLTPVSTTPVDQDSCVFFPGDGTGPNGCETYVGRVADARSCYELVKERTPAATGAMFEPVLDSTESYIETGWCYAEYFMTRIDLTIGAETGDVSCKFGTTTFELGQCVAAAKATAKAAKKAVKQGKNSVTLMQSAELQARDAVLSAQRCVDYAKEHTKVAVVTKKDKKKTKKYSKKAQKISKKAIKTDLKAAKNLQKLGASPL